MDDFRSFKTARREPAAPMKPRGRSGRLDRGRAPRTCRAGATGSTRPTPTSLLPRSRRCAATALRMVDVRKDDFPLRLRAACSLDVRRELMDGRGIVMMQDFPLDRFDREGTAIAYIGLGAHLGQTMSQNKLGHILGHVKDLGGDYRDRQHPRLHDQCRDALPHRRLRLCRPALPADAEVGRREPDRELGDGLQHHAGAAARPGRGAVRRLLPLAQRRGQRPATCRISRSRSSRSMRAISPPPASAPSIDKAQKLPGVPKFTPVQKEAIEVYRKTVDEIALDIDFQRGDIQFLNNFVMLHTRREYRRLAGAGAQAPPAAAVALRCRRPADPEGAARGPLRPRRERQGRAARRAARGGSGSRLS